EAVRHRNAASQRQARRRAHESLLGDPHIHEAMAQRLGQVPNRRAVLGRHHDKPLIGESDLAECFLVASAFHRTTRASDAICAEAPPRSSSTSRSTSSGAKSQNHLSTRPSRDGSPFPRTVRATTARGRPEANGRLEKVSSRAAKSWPSTDRVVAPNDRNFS